jgi:hypothetical protein
MFATARRVAGTYLALFFVAVAVAPHHHVNGLEDILLDQPSDSGVVVETGSPAGTADAPAWTTFWFVDDDPCLACFNGDYVSAPPPTIGFTARLDRIASHEATLPSPVPPILAKDTPSRAPPATA